ncbi:hypothetical protein N7466_001556 [Penicillium verhagenii]|uniref:uncharacterized protein n=1 Tax=Penicillium verhagenii TaxID=1562060 RepID=UPI002545581A|nr:uncharacterized protein N7466_001556 [Penicillium verhagenii]KAJ5938422.1 hypothetical protein N7466_001556 [Penicillium verhagenii]
MGKYHPSNAGHCAIISLISLLGLFYFSVLFAQVLLFHRFMLGNQTLQALSVIAFCASVILWCSLILLDQVLSIFQNGQRTVSRRSEFELGAVLAVIWTSTLPTVLHLFETQPSIQLGYAAILTIAFFVTVAELLTFDSNISVVRIRFPYHCVSLGLLCLVPALQALAENRPAFPSLATEFIHMVMKNCLGAAIYLVSPLERLSFMPRLQPSLYVMHLCLVYSLVSYSRALMQLIC